MDVHAREMNLHFYRRACELFCDAPKGTQHTAQQEQAEAVGQL